MYELGNFDQCLKINHGNSSQAIIGQYCLAQVSVSFNVARNIRNSNLNGLNGMKIKGIDTRMITTATNR